MASSGMLRRVALVRADVSEELSASIIRVTRIGELRTTLAVTSSPASPDKQLGSWIQFPLDVFVLFFVFVVLFRQRP
jgi:hypothetical protein